MKKKQVVLSIIFCLIISILWPSYSYANMDFGDLYVSEPVITRGDTVIDEETTISYHQNISLGYNYTIPDTISITSGDTMNLRVPENTLIASDFSYDITAADGSLIMTISGDSQSNTVTAIFGPFYELHNVDRQGEILFYARGTAMIENEAWVMNKVGWNSSDNTSAIWNIIINPDSKYITNALLTDILGDDQEFTDGFLLQAEIGTYDKQTQYFYPQATIDPAKISSTNSGFIVDLGTLNNAVSLTYKSNKLANPNIPYRNKAILEADGEGNPIVIEAETPGLGGGGSGSGDQSEPNPQESTSETTSTNSSTIESLTTSDSSTKNGEESTTDTMSYSSTSEVKDAIPPADSGSTKQEKSSLETSPTSTSSTNNRIKKNATKLPRTGYQKSMIRLLGYVLLFVSLSFFLIRGKKQNN
ncbi:collagen binding domain-containing protein [Enterococcus sp. AZ126]|uniref:collagen binding domain-containing protein n=1 Tax=Enterococcus sp. AZ126 TaxID=2774635 RepID=UPI003F270E0D